MLNRIAGTLFALALAALASFSTVTPSYADSGTVRIRTFGAGFIIGGRGGNGVLIFHGHSYPFDVGGIGLGTIGVSEARYVGTVHHIHRPVDIAGGWTAAGAGIAVVGGVRTAQLQNARGVVMNLRGAQAGFEASLGFGGMTITPRW